MKKAAATDWRTKMMSRIRALIKQADPKIAEEIKYRKPSNPSGIPVWYRDGMICTGETYSAHLRLTFSKGNVLKSRKKVLNSFRALVLRENDEFNETAFKALIKEAVAENQKGSAKPKAKVAKKR